MYKDWKKTSADVAALTKEVAKGIPDVAKAFGQLSQSVKTDGALSKSQKELIALGIAIAIRCESCIAFHAENAAGLKIPREQILEMIGVTIQMGGGPSFAYGAQALEAYDQFSGSA